jgi:type I restriction enzyme S subunit
MTGANGQVPLTRASRDFGLCPYAEYRQADLRWVDAIPSHWSVTRVKYFLREIDDRSTAGAETLLSMRQASGLVPFSDVSSKRIDPVFLVGYKRTIPNEIVLNRMQASNGMFARTTVTGVVSPDYAVFRPIDSVNTAYLTLLFKTPAMRASFRAESKGLGTGTAGFLRLYSDRFLAMQMPLPPRCEQDAVVRYISETDRNVGRFIRNNRRLIDLLDEQKRATIHRAITKGLYSNVPAKTSRVHWIGDMPAHWEIWQIGHFARIGNGSTPARGNTAYWVGGQYPWLNSSSVNHSVIRGSDQFVTDVALRECHLPRVQPGSVLIGITGQGKTRGKAAILETEATINQHIAYITPESELISEEFLQVCLTAAYTELRAISEDAGSTKGALTCEDLRHFRIPVPPRYEQASIVAMVRDECRDLELAAGVIERKISLVREYRTRLIADLVTGRLDVSHLPGVMEPKFVGMDALDEQADVADEEASETDELEAAEEVAIGDD